jgi:alanine racemase
VSTSRNASLPNGAGSPPATARPAWAEVDLEALAHNVRAVAALVAPAELLAVVKADAYGHGAVPVALAAVGAGARRLGVATVEEGEALRAAGIAVPILVLSEVPDAAAPAAVAARLTPVVCSVAAIESLGRAARVAQSPRRVPVHLKVDTGMHRMGCRPDDALELARLVAANPALELEGVLTHLAVADEPDHPFTVEQLGRFERVLAALDAAGLRPPIVHAANSAGAIAVPRSRYDLVRCGIAVYGVAPSPALAGRVPLRPVLSLHARVTAVRRVESGEGVSYGLRWNAPQRTTIATVPLGYADGVPRALGTSGAHVLVHGTRRPIAGTVTMDQLMVDAGDLPVELGDEVVLLGAQGDEQVTADEWAELLGTIAYEVVARLGPRVPRRYRG